MHSRFYWSCRHYRKNTMLRTKSWNVNVFSQKSQEHYYLNIHAYPERKNVKSVGKLFIATNRILRTRPPVAYIYFIRCGKCWGKFNKTYIYIQLSYVSARSMTDGHGNRKQISTSQLSVLRVSDMKIRMADYRTANIPSGSHSPFRWIQVWWVTDGLHSFVFKSWCMDNQPDRILRHSDLN
jgi:hypothetical protein